LGEPLIVKIALEPEQIGEFEVNEITVGTILTSTTAVFVRLVEQEPKVISLKSIVTSVVGEETVTVACPETGIVTNCIEPPLMV